jgi:hypothetical protein
MRFSGSSRARQRHLQAVDLLADDRAGRGHPVGRPTTPSQSASITSFPSAAHAPPATPAHHAHCAISPPPAAANRSQPKHSRCCKPCNRPRRPSGPASSPTTGGWPGPLFLPLPCARLLDRHGPPPRRHPLAKPSDPGRCGPPRAPLKASWFPTRRPGTSTAPASAPPRPRARRPPQPHRPPHTRTPQCRGAPSTRQVNTTLAASNPTTPPPQRRRPSRGAPLRAAPPPRSRGAFTPLSPGRTATRPPRRPARAIISMLSRREPGATESRPVTPTNLTRTHAVLLQPCSALTHGSSGAPAHRHLGHPNSTTSPNITPLALRSRNDNANSSVSN